MELTKHQERCLRKLASGEWKSAYAMLERRGPLDSLVRLGFLERKRDPAFKHLGELRKYLYRLIDGGEV